MTISLEKLMSAPPITIGRGATVGAAVELMRARSVHALPVVDDAGRPLGVLSASDVLGETDHEATVDRLMTSPTHTVEIFLTVQDAAAIMRDNRIHHVVVTHHGEVVGVVSSFDLIELLCTHRLAPLGEPPDREWGAD